MPDYKLRIIAEGKDKASGPLGTVAGALGNVATVAGGIIAAQVLSKVAAGIFDIGKMAISSAADTEEMLSKFQVTFGDAGAALENTLIGFAGEAGRSRFELQGMAADVGAITKAMGFDDAKAAELSGSLVQLSTDVASFMNVQDADVLDRFSRALTGEFESLKALGIVINEGVIKQKMAELGYEGTWAALDQLNRAELIHALLLDQTADAQGDAVRTSESFTNQMRALKGQLNDTVKEIGTSLLPVATRFLNFFNELWQQHGPKVIEFFEALGPKLEVVANAILGFLTGDTKLDLSQLIPPGLKSSFDGVIAGVMSLVEAFKLHWPVMLEEGQTLVAWAKENLLPVVSDVLTQIGDTLLFLADLWAEHGDKVIEVVTVIAQVVGATIGGLMTIITGLARAGMKLLRGDWDGAWQAIKDAVEKFMNLALSIVGQNLDQFIATWKSNLEMAKLIVKTVFDNIIETIKGLIGGFVNAGKDLIEGLWNGIKSKVDDVKRRLEDKLAEILSIAKKIFGLQSPSKVFEGIGRNLMEGLAVGVTRGTGGASGAVGAASNSVINAGRSIRGGSVVHISIDGAGDPRAVAREVARELRLQGVNV